MTTAIFDTATDAKAFILAGNARVTLVSERTGTRFTFQIKASAPDGSGRDPVHFVGVLSSADNLDGYRFLGTIFGGADFRLGRNSTIGADAPSAKAWAWVWKYLRADLLPPGCQIWHEGRCGRCARVLTVPESIASGIGPICAGRML